MKDETILIRATVIRRKEAAITASLEDGFGNAEVVVHQDAALPDPAPATV